MKKPLKASGRRMGRSVAMILLAGTALSSAVEHSYRYYRFQPTEVRGATALVQIAELQFFDSGGTPVSPAEAFSVFSENTDSPANEGPANAFDGLYEAPPGAFTKWLDFTFNDGLPTALVIDFGTTTVGEETLPNRVTIDSYNYVTANDANDRDPVSWILQGRDDELEPWVTIDAVYDFVPNAQRYVPASDTNFVLPASPLPHIEIFEADFYVGQETIITADPVIDLYAAVSAETDSLTLTIGDAAPTNVPLGGGEAFFSPSVPTNSDTTFTATAISAGGTETRSLLVRSVQATSYAGLTQVRFTPIKTRNGRATTQVADITFYGPSGEEIPTGASGGTTPEALLDFDGNTKWISSDFEPVTFTFPAPVELEAYEFYVANDAPERDPLQWSLEGSTDNGASWFLIDTATGIDYPVPVERFQRTQEFPLIAPGSFAPVLGLAVDPPLGGSGETITVDYSVAAADTAELQPSPGALTPAEGTGTTSFVLAADTDVTLTATASSGRSASRTVRVALLPPFDGSFDYPDFDDPVGINLVGDALLINDFANIPGDPDANRIRLTQVVNGQAGAAWYYEPIDLSGGFTTSFDMEFTSNVYANGADDLSFVVQNTADGNAFLGGQAPDPAAGPSLAIVFDSYANAGDLGWSSVKVFVNGSLVQQVGLAEYGTELGLTFYDDDGAFNDVWFFTKGYGNPDGYLADITYVPGSLTVVLGGITIIDQLAVDLGPTGSAVLDEEGKAYVGFSAHTGGLAENHDVLSWSLSTENITVPGGGLALVDFSFDLLGSPPTVTLTWASEAGKLYDITASTGLSDWTTVLANDVVGSAGTTTTTVELPVGSTGFFRVEEDAGGAP